jgi:hypothetical protein
MGDGLVEIIHKSRIVHVEQYFFFFEDRGCPGAGYSFPCTRQGEILRDQVHSLGLENLENCLAGVFPVIARGVQDCSYNYLEYAIGCCSCGQEVELFAFTNTCEQCGLEYNAFGQLLAPRSQWTPY